MAAIGSSQRLSDRSRRGRSWPINVRIAFSKRAARERRGFPASPSPSVSFGKMHSGTGIEKAQVVGDRKSDRCGPIPRRVRLREGTRDGNATRRYIRQAGKMSGSNARLMRIEDGADEASMVGSALQCVDAFTDRFNARDLPGMDALLHFPHVILVDEKLVIWDGPDQLPPSFFDDLTASTGWDRSTYRDKRAVLASPRKVHLVVEYTRDRADGTIASHHSNLWIVTFESGRWGIKQRSY